MITNKLEEVLLKMLNTNSILNFLDKKTESGDRVIDRFGDIQINKNFTLRPYKDIIEITMFINSDLEYISCDDLYFDFDIDPAWWEHHIINENVLVHLGMKGKFQINITVKSKDGKHSYCSEYD